MMKFLELYISGLFSWVMNYYIGKHLFKQTNTKYKLKLIISIMIFAILLVSVNFLGFEIYRGVPKIIISYIMLCIFYKMIFKNDMSSTVVTSFIMYLIFFASEIILAFAFSIVFYFIDYSSLEILQNTIIINVLNTLISYFIIMVFKDKFIKLTKNNKFTDIGSILIILLLLVMITLLFFKLPLSKWSFNIEFIITMIMLFGGCLIGLLILKQKAEINKTTSMYQQLAEYSNITNNVLEEYRVVTHEHKNQLLIIRSMLENKDTEINDYVDNLLEKREGIKYKWIGQLNHLPLSGLKGLLNYKILEMENLKLNKIITISNEVAKLKLEKMTIKQKDNLYSIMGVYLDNAIQAARESKEKEINLEIYKESKELVIILANTYKGHINLEKIDEYGYTTKGKKHGVGLHIVRNIIKNQPIFYAKTYTLDNYFVQEIRIDLKQIKTK